jgi:hypothetical protein
MTDRPWISPYALAMLFRNPPDRPPFTDDILDGFTVRKPITELVVDKTGVGVAVTDLLKERHLNHIAVTITGLGQKVNRTSSREYSVPKLLPEGWSPGLDACTSDFEASQRPVRPYASERLFFGYEGV